MSGRKKMPNENKGYIDIPMPYTFFAEFGALEYYPSNPFPQTYEEKSFDELLQIQTSPDAPKQRWEIDRERTFWRFGKKSEGSEADESQEVEIKFDYPEYLKLASDVDPAALNQHIHQALQNEAKNSSTRLDHEVITEAVKEISLIQFNKNLELVQSLLKDNGLALEMKMPSLPVKDSLEQIREALEWFESGKKLLMQRDLWVGQGVELSASESAFLCVSSCHIGDGVSFQGGNTWGEDWNLITIWFKPFNMMFDVNSATRDKNRLVRLEDGTLKISTTSVVKNGMFIRSSGIADDVQASGAGEYLFKLADEKTVAQTGNQFKLIPNEEMHFNIDRAFMENVLMVRAEEILSTNQKLTRAELFSLIPLLYDSKFRQEFCVYLALRPKDEYYHITRLIEQCYRTRPDDLRKIKATLFNVDDFMSAVKDDPDHNKSEALKNLRNYNVDSYNAILKDIREKCNNQRMLWYRIYFSIPLLTRAKNFIKNNPLAVISTGLGIALAVTGAVLAATGFLAPLGVALGVGGAAMVAPGAVAAVSAVCLVGGTSVLYGALAAVKHAFLGIRNCVRKMRKPGGEGVSSGNPSEDNAVHNSTRRTPLSPPSPPSSPSHRGTISTGSILQAQHEASVGNMSGAPETPREGEGIINELKINPPTPPPTPRSRVHSRPEPGPSSEVQSDAAATEAAAPKPEAESPRRSPTPRRGSEDGSRH